MDPVYEDMAPVIPPSQEVQEAMAANPDTTQGLAQLAIVEIMKTDPDAAFEWPASGRPTRGVTYTPPSGDA